MPDPLHWLRLDQPGVPTAVRERIGEQLAESCPLFLVSVARHERVLTIDDVRRVVRIEPHDLVKSLALVAGMNTMLLACIDGASKLDVRAVRSLVGGRPVRFAAAAEVLSFGASVGALSPMLASVPVLMDRALLYPARYVCMGSGDPEWSARVHTSTLLKLGRIAVAELSKR